MSIEIQGHFTDVVSEVVVNDGEDERSNHHLDRAETNDAAKGPSAVGSDTARRDASYRRGLTDSAGSTASFLTAVTGPVATNHRTSS